MEINKANQELIRDLQRQGVEINPLSFLTTRFQIFLDTFFPMDTQERWAFEVRFEENMNEQLATVLSEINKAKLLEGVANFGKDTPHLRKL